jgi:hypothetical protein
VNEHAVPFDRGFVECDVVQDEKSTQSAMQSGEQVERFYPSGIPPCEAVTRAALEAIAEISKVRVQTLFHVNIKDESLE